MGDVDPEYSQRYSHATVSRWESGLTRPTVERLRTFGKALNLSEYEVAGLLLLTRLAPDFEAAQALSTLGDEAPVTSPMDESGPLGTLQPLALVSSLRDRPLPREPFRFLVLQPQIEFGRMELLVGMGWG